MIHERTSKPNRWMDGEGVQTMFARSKSGTRSSGERVMCIRWTADNTVTLRHMRGDGRTASFKVYDEAEHVTMTEAEVRQYAAERLTKKEDR